MNQRFVAMIVLLFGMSGAVRADGLILRLPEDGSFVRYSLQGTMVRDGAESPLSVTLSIASVGKAEENGQACRWIEINMVRAQGTTISKLLIPEKYLQKGEDPLAHVVRGYMKRGDNQVQALSERGRGLFLPGVLAGPLQDGKPLEKRTIENDKLGKVECEGVAGVARQQREQFQSESKYELRTSDKSPFGVVSGSVEFVIKREGADRFKGKYTLTLTDCGTDAKSELPDSK